MSDIKAALGKKSKQFDKENPERILLENGLVERLSYSFKLCDMLYVISPLILAKVLLWLYETKDGHKNLDILKKVMRSYEVTQRPVQAVLCEYMSGGYKEKDYAKRIMMSDVEFLIPVLDDDRFIAFFTNMQRTAFTELIERTIQRCYTTGEIISPQRMLTLVNAYPFDSVSTYHQIIVKVNLYAFLSDGIVPKETGGKDTIDGLTLSALMNAYKGNYSDALKLFRQAQVLYNSVNPRALRCTLLPQAIVNFLYIMCCKKEGGEVAMRTLQNFSRYNETNKTAASRAAMVLVALFLNKRNYTSDIVAVYKSSAGLIRQMMVLLLRFIGKTNLLSDEAYREYSPKWLCLKNEYDKYVPMTDEERDRAAEAYSSNKLLTSMYMKQQWEIVLESLSKGGHNVREDADRRLERIAYFMQEIHDDVCEIRQQTILKSGAWSSGKQISLSTFFVMDEEYLSLSDMRIREAARASRTSYNYINIEKVLPEMVNETRLYVGRNAPYSLVTVNEEMPYLVIETTDVGYNIRSNVPAELADKDVIVTSRSSASINFLRMKSDIRPYFSQLLDLGHFPLEAKDALTGFLEGLRGKIEVHSELLRGGSTLETVKGTSAITLQLRPQGKEAYIVSIFCRALETGRVQCVPGEGSSVIMDIQGDHRVAVERDLNLERELYLDLVNVVEDTLPPEKTFQVDAYDLIPILDFVREANARMRESVQQGGEEIVQETTHHPNFYNVEWPEGHKLNVRSYHTVSSWSASLKKNENGWFEMEGSVEIDEKTRLSMSQLLDLIRQSRRRYIRLSDSDFLAISEKLRRQLSSLELIAAHSHGRLQISPFSAALLDASVIDGDLHLEVDPELKEIRQRILDSSEYRPPVPDGLTATLREYQKEGFQWIARLNSWGAGALLADDMGLGKTVQTIAYLLLKAQEGPALVVAPASVAPNWKTEIEKFAPSLNVEVLNFAANRSTCIAGAKAGDVIITTYGLLLSVKEEITKKEWTVAVLDEAHVIKNRGAKTSGVAMQIKTKHRVMLTGTPVQNHLGELWNLFQFVNPGLLGSYDDFNHRFIVPIEIGGDKERQKDLDRLVHPFMLRRTKEKVLAELPEKTEIYQTVELSKEEMAVYETIREKAEQMLEAEGTDKVSMNTLAEITRLRQAACSAQLIEKRWKGKTSKIEALVEALEPIVESGDSVLVFSQFTSFLHFVRKALDKEKIPYLYIDGSVSVKERQALVERFQNGECPIFVISLKAGGLGLNLTRANYVFHLDPWWNPAIEQQATDRAHRIGQHNAVTVYHFLSAGTIEEKIKRLHERKRDLAENVLDGTDMSGKLTGRDLLELISAK